jgi:hypothetical protein
MSRVTGDEFSANNAELLVQSGPGLRLVWLTLG